MTPRAVHELPVDCPVRKKCDRGSFGRARRECDWAARARTVACCHPGNGFELSAASIERHAQDAFAQIADEILGHGGAAHEMIAGDLNLVEIRRTQRWARTEENGSPVIADEAGGQDATARRASSGDRPASFSGRISAAESPEASAAEDNAARRRPELRADKASGPCVICRDRSLTSTE